MDGSLFQALDRRKRKTRASEEKTRGEEGAFVPPHFFLAHLRYSLSHNYREHGTGYVDGTESVVVLSTNSRETVTQSELYERRHCKSLLRSQFTQVEFDPTKLSLSSAFPKWRKHQEVCYLRVTTRTL